ncbi:hypothetical protein MKX01_035063 [Papaver californicum]|nr:hypothetical protein MKX01_035063 [Papaver californicum]
MKFVELILPILIFFFSLWYTAFSYPTPLNCSDTSRVCTSFIAYNYKQKGGENVEKNLQVIQSMFDVLPQDITIEGNNRDYVYIKKNCSCFSPIHKYLTTTTYTVRQNQGSVYDMVREAYAELAYINESNRTARYGAVISLRLLCGCSSGLWNYLMSYVLKEGDSIGSLASRFGVSMESIESLNGITNPDNVTVGDLYYIPLDSVPGDPYPQKTASPAPVPAPSDEIVIATEAVHKSRFPYGWVIGGAGGALLLICVTIIICVYCQASKSRAKDPNGKIPHKFHILGRSSFCCASGRDWKPNNEESGNRQINIPKAMGADVFDMEKPVVFNYEEILSATESFSDSYLLGHGTYGSVYYAVLRDQEVAIKRMAAMKTKEFLSEMKVLCKVHHSNLVELIGYAASDEELFLIYEHAQKGSLGSHLHDPHNKGNSSLSWIVRVQVALDAARGLEYIHEHTKTHYVHRDVKTSNILLDNSFRAKISDFGLAKLVGKTGEGEASVTKVVGTFGYLAPEYLSDGRATTKSDVYAFGVVLFELLSGKEAIARYEGPAYKNPERRSLASIMLAALKNSTSSMSMTSLRECIDPNLVDLYPYDCVYKVAMLAKHCIDEDPILRPDMKQVVITLSQILLSSVEWEATLAGNSQVFSGLVQGR